SFLLVVRCLPLSTLFPYTTLFRSTGRGGQVGAGRALVRGDGGRCACAAAVGRGLGRRGCRRGRNGGIAATGGPTARRGEQAGGRSEEHTSELQSRGHLVCRLLLEK